MKVAAFIVTYNRLELLKKAIDGLRSQTRPIDLFFVVNNASTDGTTEWLASQPDLNVINQDNVGGAGGFHVGVKHAYGNGADWVWMMDDDVQATPTALEEMLKYSEFSKAILPSRKTVRGDVMDWYGGIRDLHEYKRVHYTRLKDFDLSKKFIICSSVYFEGLLIHRDIVEKIGFPDARFFIAGDDTVYGIMANYYTNIILVRDAYLLKTINQTPDTPLSAVTLYYSIRNHHLLLDYIRKATHRKKLPINYQAMYWSEQIVRLYSLVIHKKYRKKIYFKAFFYGLRDNMLKKTGATHSIIFN